MFYYHRAPACNQIASLTLTNSRSNTRVNHLQVGFWMCARCGFGFLEIEWMHRWICSIDKKAGITGLRSYVFDNVVGCLGIFCHFHWWWLLGTSEISSPTATTLIGFTTLAKLARFESTATSTLYTLPFSFYSDGATGKQGAGVVRQHYQGSFFSVMKVRHFDGWLEELRPRMSC